MNKILSSFLRKLDSSFFLKHGFRSDCKNSEQILPVVEKVIVLKLIVGFWIAFSNLLVNEYWESADLLFLIKNRIWDGYQ